MPTVGPASRSPPELVHRASERHSVCSTKTHKLPSLTNPPSCICNVEGAHEMSVVWRNANMCSVHQQKRGEKQQIPPTARGFTKKSEEAEKEGVVANKESRKDGGKRRRFAV